MPNISSAKKRMRAEEKRRLHNNVAKSTVRTRVTKARNAIAASAAAPETDETVRAALRSLDMAVSRGVIHRNNAARRKSRLMARLHAAQEADAAK
ncbi:MAG TPA: 30S ribosomal protein S20 [Ktedonobacterales bacterium]|nr:30S ribosomal protein S20 [Ktedonobacterales bacterium]